jgi:hypothetical protein
MESCGWIETPNYFLLLCESCHDHSAILNNAIEITKKKNAKEILLKNKGQILSIIFKKYLTETVIENIFKIFNYEDLKTYKILHFIPIEYLLISIKNMKELKINQDLFLIQDINGNTPFHKIINHTIKQSFLIPIWQQINKSIKKSLHEITNCKGMTIYDIATSYKIKLS